MIDFSKYQNIITLIKITDEEHYENIYKIKGRLILIDNSFLDFREVYNNNKLIAYSYYWISQIKNTLIGWDNAPHHKEINTYPHHKHIKGNILESKQHNMDDVLKYIESNIYKSIK